jgi:hypothetical protein
MRMKNIEADTQMRGSIAGTGSATQGAQPQDQK